jgi:hypothetical protein
VKIELTYFKESGKYYTQGEFDVPDETHYYDVIDMVKKMIVDEELPGLASGCWEFDVLMEPKGEKCSVPHLFRAGRA